MSGQNWPKRMKKTPPLNQRKQHASMSNCLTSLLPISEQWFYGNRSVNYQRNRCNYHVCPSILAPHFWQCYRKMSFIGFKSTLSNLNKILAFVIWPFTVTIIADVIANINGSEDTSVKLRQIIIGFHWDNLMTRLKKENTKGTFWKCDQHWLYLSTSNRHLK